MRLRMYFNVVHPNKFRVEGYHSIPDRNHVKLASETITSMKEEGNKTLERAVKSGRKKLHIFLGSSGTHFVAGRKKEKPINQMF